jgi:hypothetical protein
MTAAAITAGTAMRANRPDHDAIADHRPRARGLQSIGATRRTIMQTRSPDAPFETIDASELAATTGGGKVADKIGQVGQEVLPAIQNALPAIGNVASAFEDLIK